MCLMKAPKPQVAPAPPAAIPRAQPIEDMAPRVKIAGEDAMSSTSKKQAVNARGTKSLQTGLSTSGAMTSSGLSIPQ
jgi:hypothetical protein